MKKLLTNTSICLIASLVAINDAPAAEATDFDFGFKAGFESFKWEEFDQKGASLLTETGTRFVAGGFIGNTSQLNKTLIYNAEIRNYFGAVDYDGQTQDGIPATTTTNYSGFNVIGEIGGRMDIANSGFAWDFVGKADIDTWVRNLESSRDATGQPTGEAQENYLIFNVRIGTGPAWDTGNWKGRVIFGVKQPVYTYEYIDNIYTGFTEDTILRPKGRNSAFLTFNNDIQLTKTLHLKIDGYYDSYRFDRSDPVEYVAIGSGGGNGFVWQPQSFQDTYGILAGLGWNF